MTTTKKRIPIIVSIIALISVLMSSSVFCTNAATWGTTGTKTITVITKANYWLPGSSSITLKQTKGTYQYKKYSLFKGYKTITTSGYGTYKITATPIKGNGKVKKATMTGSSKTINLDKNTTYRITVSYDSNATWLNSNCKCSSWITKPSWKVSSNWKVSSCY